MLDGEVPEKVDDVWGFADRTRSGGRRKWPETLRAVAVERIEVNKSLVAVWVKNAKREDPVPAFFEIVPPTAVKPGRKQGTTVAATDAAPTCRISIGDADISIPPGYPADHLTEILRAVRASQ